MVNPLANAGQYSKAIIAFIGAVVTGLATQFPAAHWLPLVMIVLNAFAVYIVPNMPGESKPAVAV